MYRLTILLVLAACTLRPYDFDASATATDATSSSTTATDPTTSSTGTTSSTSTTSTTDATSGSTGTTGQPFIQPQDGGSSGKECDQWIQDCPEGQKCMPYSGDGDNAWESLKCVPIVRDPDGLGDPCTVFDGGVSGKDTCDKHMMCWNVDPETGLGHCVGQCKGSPADPKCDEPVTKCLVAADGVLTLCLPACDPLAQDCPDADLCLPNPQDPNSFKCFPDASGDEGQAFDPCEDFDACDIGLLCATPVLAAECDPMAAGCCLPFCDTSVMPPLCPGKDQQCLPWYEEGQAPPGLELVGVCGLPQ